MNNLFYNINDLQKEKILQYLEGNTLSFKKNVTILSSVKQENIIGIILSGYIQIVKTDYNGNNIILEELFDNDVFGSTMSLISNNECNIITKEDTKLIVIYFKEIVNNNINYNYFNQFLKNLLQILSNKISNNNERIEILTNKTIRNKLLSYFKIMSRKNNSKVIYLPYNYTDLADYLAVDRSSMYRELKSLKEDGLITVKNKKITLNMYDE